MNPVKKILGYSGLAILSIIAILAINLVICSITAERISEGSPIPEYEEPGAALLVVDVQEGTTGVVSVTDTYIHHAEGLIQKINQLATANSMLPPFQDSDG